MRRLQPLNPFFQPFFSEDYFPEEWDSSSGTLPKVDVHEKDKEIILKADLPGVDREDISLKIQNGKVIIDASSNEKEEEKDEEKKYWVRERSMHFRREISLPKDVDPEEVSAKMKNGTLTIKMPKSNVSDKEVEIEFE